jgi:hypothetical protein
LLHDNLGLVNRALSVSLPATVGNCTKARNALGIDDAVGNEQWISNNENQFLSRNDFNSSSCIDVGDLYYERSRWLEVKARWVSGINNARLDSAILSVPADHRLSFAIEGRIAGELPLSLKIGQCFNPAAWITGKCTTLWDNTSACCGSDKSFTVIIDAECNDSEGSTVSLPHQISLAKDDGLSGKDGNNLMFIRNVSMRSLHIEPLVVQESLLGLFTINVKDITSSVQESIMQLLSPFIFSEHPRRFIPWSSSGREVQYFSLIEMLNQLIVLNAGGDNGFKCPAPSQ